jgi:ubiquinone/menaquinone biosynthesis C-methylase UbiE
MEKDVKKRFDESSKQYVTDSFIERDRSAHLVSELANPEANDIILDLGCGPGRQIIELSYYIRLGIGIDISDGMLEQAVQNANIENRKNLEFYSGTFGDPEKNIDLRAKHITKIISNYALHHLSLSEKKEAIHKMIYIGGPGLQTIVIGDLMLFEEPENIHDVFKETGYVPGIDFPSTVEEMIACFADTPFKAEVHKLHAVVGVLVAKREKGTGNNE